MQLILPALVIGTLFSVSATAVKPLVVAPAPISTEPAAMLGASLAKRLKPELSCRRGETIIGLCGAEDSLFPTCNVKFKKSCEVAGGTTSSCGPDGSDCGVVVHCSYGSPLFHDCGKDFQTACKDNHGSFDCQSSCSEEEEEGGAGTCCGGNCTLPD